MGVGLDGIMVTPGPRTQDRNFSRVQFLHIVETIPVVVVADWVRLGVVVVVVTPVLFHRCSSAVVCRRMRRYTVDRDRGDKG